MKNLCSNTSFRFALAFILWGGGLTVLSTDDLLERLLLSINGSVVKAEYIKEPSGPHRYYIDYYINQGKEGYILKYRAGGNSTDLSRDIKVGSIIKKKKWQLSYTVNGALYDDFHKTASFIMISLGFILFFTGLFLILRQLE